MHATLVFAFGGFRLADFFSFQDGCLGILERELNPSVIEMPAGTPKFAHLGRH